MTTGDMAIVFIDVVGRAELSPRLSPQVPEVGTKEPSGATLKAERSGIMP